MPGQQFLTATGALGVSGKPTKVYSVNIVSGASQGNVKLYSGTSASGSYVEVDGVSNGGLEQQLGGNSGKSFPGGCWAVLTNVTSAEFSYETYNTI